MLSLPTPPTEIPEVVLIPTLPESGYSPENNRCSSSLWSPTDLGLDPGPVLTMISWTSSLISYFIVDIFKYTQK